MCKPDALKKFHEEAAAAHLAYINFWEAITIRAEEEGVCPSVAMAITIGLGGGFDQITSVVHGIKHLEEAARSPAAGLSELFKRIFE